MKTRKDEEQEVEVKTEEKDEASLQPASSELARKEGGSASKTGTTSRSKQSSPGEKEKVARPTPGLVPDPASRIPSAGSSSGKHSHSHHYHSQHSRPSSRSSSGSKRREMPPQQHQHQHQHQRGGKAGTGTGTGYPWDMESLKEAITSAEAGQVKNLIIKSAFTPRAPAFTALINLCGKEKSAEKALEVFETSQELNIEKNTYMYSALISALGSSGKWELAFEFFEKMLQENSDICKPNTITYSALISACERAGQVEKAWEVFERMKADGVTPDLITYSVLLTACEKQNLWDKSIEIMDQMHAKSMHASQLNYSRVISALGEAGEVNQAIEIFLQLQLAGGEISLNLCNIMLSCLERNERGDLAYHLLRSMHENGIVGESVSYNMVLAALSKSFDPSVIPLMLEIYNMMKFFGVRITTYTSSLLIKACERFNDPNTAIQLTHEFQQLNIALDQATLEILNRLVRGM